MEFTTEQHPGVDVSPAKQTRGFELNHSMLRIKDPRRSLAFYTAVLGMRVIRKLDLEELGFSLYFLGYPQAQNQPPEDPHKRTQWMFGQRGILEFTHNWGSEDDDSVDYHNGNDKPQGFGHICVSVPDLDAATKWFDDNEVTYVKRPDDGKLKDVAFIKDPDGYWIEVVEPARLGDLGDG